MFWIVLLVLFLISLLIILIPLKHFRDGKSENQDSGGQARDKSLMVYKAQLNELDLDHQMGRLAETEAAAARLEIERRLLKIDADPTIVREGNHLSLPLMATMTTLILLSCMTLYLTLGLPGMPDFILADQSHSQAVQADKNPNSQEAFETIETLESHLEQNPNDLDAWRALGQSYGQLQNWTAAARAYQHWYDQAPDSIDAAVIYGESLIMMHDGKVGPAALLVMTRAQVIQPRNPGVRHYLALADYQAGNIELALRNWKLLESESKPGVPWLGQLRFWIGRAEKDLGIETARQVIPAISAEQRNAVAQMSEEDQLALIKGMVGRLQATMDARPENIEGWLQLANAYRVLGQNQDAVTALEKALSHLTDQTPEDLIAQIKKQLEILRK